MAGMVSMVSVGNLVSMVCMIGMVNMVGMLGVVGMPNHMNVHTAVRLQYFTSYSLYYRMIHDEQYMSIYDMIRHLYSIIV